MANPPSAPVQPNYAQSWETSRKKSVYDLAQALVEKENEYAGEILGGGVQGLYSQIDMLTWLKYEVMLGWSDENKRDTAINLTQYCEEVQRPRSMGMAATDDTTGKDVWADEVICYKAPVAQKGARDVDSKGYYYWWSKRNEPPVDHPPGHRWHESHDYIVIELPIREDKRDPHQPLDPKTLAHFNGSKMEAREAAWDRAAYNYGKNVDYKMRRGNAESWAEKVSEPAVFMPQKPRGTPQAAYENRQQLYKQQCLYEFEQLTPVITKLVVFRDVWRQLEGQGKTPAQIKTDPALDAVDADKEIRGGNWNAQLIDLWMRREQFRRQYQKIIDVEVEMAKDPNYIKLPPGWQDQKVDTPFADMNAEGREMFRGIWSQLAIALSRSRRTQPRMVRIIGIEPPDRGEITADSVIYSRLSDAFDYNELLANAILNRSGLVTKAKEKDLKEINQRLNEYRKMMGLEPVEFHPNIEYIPFEKAGQGKREVPPGSEEKEAYKAYLAQEEGYYVEEGEEEGKEEKKGKKPAPPFAGGVAPTRPQPVVAAKSKEEEMLSKRQWQEKVMQYKKNTPPPNWTHTRAEWRSEPPMRREKKWEHYLASNAQGFEEVDDKLMAYNDKIWGENVIGDDEYPPEDRG